MRLAVLALIAGTLPALSQEPGWHYSPLPGEGDRAAMGCGYEADSSHYTCLVIRCEDDFSTGLHIHTSRQGGDAGRWRIDIDEDGREVVATADNSPYGARVDGDVTGMIDQLRNGAVAYLDPLDGEPVSGNGISLSGSFYVINQALYFCAPRNVPEVVDPEGTGSPDRR